LGAGDTVVIEKLKTYCFWHTSALLDPMFRVDIGTNKKLPADRSCLSSRVRGLIWFSIYFNRRMISFYLAHAPHKVLPMGMRKVPFVRYEESPKGKAKITRAVI
jgi:hypothetical protein